MSIYKKLNTARKMLAASPLKKTGYNAFGKWAYFNLDDFLPRLVEIFDEVGLCDSVQITNDRATLSIFDTDSEGSIEFACQVPPQFELKGQNPVQLAGSVQTYLRRYLYVTALAISENDVIDQADQNAEQKAKDDQKAAYDSLVVEKMNIISNIKTGIANQDLAFAKESWDELSHDEKSALWKAPTKGGIFTTAERTVIQSSEFRTALDNPVTGANP
jgi:hypothetical protein